MIILARRWFNNRTHKLFSFFEIKCDAYFNEAYRHGWCLHQPSIITYSPYTNAFHLQITPAFNEARYCNPLMPGRKKYAPPLTLVNAGILLSVFLIGFFGITIFNVPS